MKTKVKKKRNANSILNKAVEKFKNGETKYFDLIYFLCLKRLELLSKNVNFGLLKYDINDFIQDALIHIFNHIIIKYDKNRGAKFTTFLYREIKQFKYRFIKKNRRREILIEFENDEEINFDLQVNRERIKNSFLSNQQVDRRLILKEYISKLYKKLNPQEKQIFKELYNHKYMNESYDAKVIIAYRCGIKYRRLKYIMESIEDKFYKIRDA